MAALPLARAHESRQLRRLLLYSSCFIPLRFPSLVLSLQQATYRENRGSMNQIGDSLPAGAKTLEAIIIECFFVASTNANLLG